MFGKRKLQEIRFQNSDGKIETFKCPDMGGGICQIRNSPILTQYLSFGDSMQLIGGTWQVVQQSRYSTAILLPLDGLFTPAGQAKIEAALAPVSGRKNVLVSLEQGIRSFAILPEDFAACASVLDAGEGKLWSWALISNRLHL